MQAHLETTRLNVIHDPECDCATGDPHKFGVFAEAQIRISLDSHPKGFVTRFVISSPGIWDCDDEEFAREEYGQEEMSELSKMLLALGIGPTEQREDYAAAAERQWQGEKLLEMIGEQ